jgi:hypothetical protein
VKLAALIDEMKRTTGYEIPLIVTPPAEDSKSTPMLGFNDVPGENGTSDKQKNGDASQDAIPPPVRFIFGPTREYIALSTPSLATKLYATCPALKV